MLDTPTKGFLRSVAEHRVELQSMCDWIEACILFSETELSQREIIDVLVEKHIYDDQDFALERVEDAWVELKHRSKLLRGSASYRFSGQSIERVGRPWFDNPSYAFLVTLSLAERYPSWAKSFGKNFTQQGELFERLLEQSLIVQFPGWSVHRTGWNATAPAALSTIVADVSGKLDESMGKVEQWTAKKQKDAGLDLVLWRPFEDARGSYPVYLVQCASGGGWEGKLHTPELSIWTRVIDFRSRGHPKKAFAMPFVLDQAEFTRHVNRVEGLLLDRMRISAAGSIRAGWIPADLAVALRRWGQTRIKTLPKFD